MPTTDPARISSLLHTSAHDLGITLSLMLDGQGPAYTLKTCTDGMLRLDEAQAAQNSHRKAFATAARKALKQLEKGEQP